MDTKKTIMVVDDNPDIITIVKTILEGRGYNVVSASSGPELLNMLTTQKPDLIILDIMMPEMDGLEVLTRLKGKTETSTSGEHSLLLGGQAVPFVVPGADAEGAGSLREPVDV